MSYLVGVSLFLNACLVFACARRGALLRETEYNFMRYRDSVSLRARMQPLANLADRDLVTTERDLLHTAVVYLYTREHLKELTPEEIISDKEQFAQICSKGEATMSTPSVIMEQSRRNTIELLRWMDEHNVRSHSVDLVRRAVVRTV